MTTLEKIKAEIQKVLDKERDFTSENAKAQAIALNWVLALFDKYAEQEPADKSNLEKICEELAAENDNLIEAYKQVCKERDIAIEQLHELGYELGQKIEPCDDVVSRQAVLDLIEHYNSDGLGSVFYGYEEGVKFANAVNKLPSVRPQEQTGHWIRQDNTKEPLYGWYFCSECNSVIGDKTKFCSNCGARMVDPQERSDKE